MFEADASALRREDSTIAGIAGKRLGLSLPALPKKLRGQGWQYCGPATVRCRCGEELLCVFRQASTGDKVATVCDRWAEVLTLDGVKGKYRNRVIAVAGHAPAEVGTRPARAAQVGPDWASISRRFMDVVVLPLLRLDSHNRWTIKRGPNESLWAVTQREVGSDVS